MNIRRVLSSIAACLLIGVVVGASGIEIPVVRQPQEWAVGAQIELEVYLDELDRLAETLAEKTFASQRIHARRGWNAWRVEDFCGYVQGLLSARSYETVIVQSDHGTEEPYAWLLVGLALSDTATAWIPVDPSPDLGDRQETLGRIALAAGRTLDDPVFAEAYMTYDRVIELPANRAPRVTIGDQPNPIAHEREYFRARGTYDPDGKIVLYVWDFGDGVIKRATSNHVWHRYTAGGDYTVTLIVVDERGATATDSRVVSVDRDCGCG